MKTGFLLALPVIALASVAHAEDAVLVSSTLPNLKPGAVIMDSQTLNLPDGQSATLLLRSGSVVKIKGPFNRAFRSEGETPNVVALVQELRKQGVDVSVIGASRATSPTPPKPQRILIDAQRSGIYCVTPNDSVWLTRQNNAPSEIEMRNGAMTKRIVYGAATEVQWPDDVKLSEFEQFETMAQGKPPAVITIRKIAVPQSEPQWIAETMLLGCKGQVAAQFNEFRSNIEKNGS